MANNQAAAESKDPARADLASPLNFGLLIHQVREGLARRIETGLEMGRLDLNFNQFRVLKALLEGYARTPGELARLMRHDAGAMTRLLDRLVERGCLVREHCAADRRQTFLVLTDEGRALGARMLEVASAAVAQTLAPLSPDERETLMNLLGRLLLSVDAPTDPNTTTSASSTTR